MIAFGLVLVGWSFFDKLVKANELSKAEPSKCKLIA